MYFKQYTVTLLLALSTFTGCNDTANPKTQHQHYDAKKLLFDKCTTCHNTDMPPQTSETEKAPPMYTVTIHLKDWIKGDTSTEKKQKFIAFLQTYVLNPSRKISYCDKKSLDKYGLMPSQKGNITTEEIAAIATYIHQHYDQMKMLELVKERNRIARLPLHEQVLESYDCKLPYLRKWQTCTNICDDREEIWGSR